MDRSFTRDLRRRGRRLRLSLVPTTGGTQTAYCIGTAIRCMITGTPGRDANKRIDGAGDGLSSACTNITTHLGGPTLCSIPPITPRGRDLDFP